MQDFLNGLSTRWKVAGAGLIFTAFAIYNYLSHLKPKQWKALKGQMPLIIAGVIVLVIIIVGVAIWAAMRRHKQEAARQAAIDQRVANGPTLFILPRRDWSSVDIKKVMLWSRLADVLPPKEHCAFELSGNSDSILFSIHASAEAAPYIVTQLQQEWPNVQRRAMGDVINDQPLGDPAAPPEGWATYWCEIAPRLPDKPIYPASTDPLMAVLAEIANWPDNVRAVVQVLARPDDLTRQKLNQQALNMRTATAMKTAAVKGRGANPTGAIMRGVTNKQARELDERAEGADFLEATIRLAAMSERPETAKRYAKSLARTLCVQFGPSNPLGITNEGLGDAPVRERALGKARSWSDSELGMIAHLVGNDAYAHASQLISSAAKILPPSILSRIPKAARVAHIQGRENGYAPSGKDPWIVAGTFTDSAGKVLDIGFPLADLQTHSAVVGTTGSGKSTFLRALGAQCFDLDSTVYIQEPHGDLCLDLIAAIPESALRRVTYLNLNGLMPPSIPLLTSGIAGGVSVAVDTAMRCLRVAEPNSWDASQKMREVFRHSLTLLLLIEGEKANLVSLGRLLKESESVYREMLIAQAPEEAEEAVEFFQSKLCPALDGEKGTSDTRTAIEGAVRRLSVFLNDDRFRRSLACPALGPRISMKEIMAGGRMVLVPVMVAKLGDVPGRIFGTLMMDMVKNEFLSREEKAERNPTVVVLDEFATMAGSEIGKQVNILLAQARKFGACVVLATQSAAQLPQDVRVEFDGNTNLKVCLLVRREDDARAAITALGTNELDTTDLTGIEKFHGYVKPVVRKATQPPCYLKMLPPVTLAGLPPTHARIDVPPVPSASKDFKRIKELAKEAMNPKDPNSGREVIRYLASMDEATWRGVVQECLAVNRYQAMLCLADPKREPDKVKRALKISGGLYGMQWYFLEAYARRLRKGGVNTDSLYK